jgi:isoleucyl-tRNA synthetase
MALGTLYQGQNAYKNVLTTGFVLDEQGRKMSKSVGNTVDVWDVINELGADMVRWYLYSASTLGNSFRFGPTVVSQNVKPFFLVLWNSVNFFLKYTSTDSVENLELPSKPNNVLDQWVLSRLASLSKELTASMEQYDVFRASNMLSTFVIKDLSTWYIRRSRDRIGNEVVNSSDKQDCYDTLYFVLLTLTKLLAPFTPFLAEQLYQQLKPGLNEPLESVHFEKWPLLDTWQNQDLEVAMEQVRAIVERGHAARKDSSLRVRQPLRAITVFNSSNLSDEFVDLIKDELNVKEVEFVSGEGQLAVELDTALDEQLLKEGVVREAIREIQRLRREAGYNFTSVASVSWVGTDQKAMQALEEFKEELTSKTSTLIEIQPISDADVHSQIETDLGTIQLAIKEKSSE